MGGKCAFRKNKIFTAGLITLFLLPLTYSVRSNSKDFGFIWNLPSIFFVETTWTKTELTLRETCAIASAAKHNPNIDVLLIHLSPLIDNIESVSLGLLETYSNFRLVRMELTDIFADTPLELYDLRSRLSRSDYPLEHLSDAIRFALLYKYGGIYLDTDVIVLRPLDALFNMVAFENNDFIGSAVLVFNRYHPFMRSCLQELADRFQPNKYAGNGPALITRMYKQKCNISQPTDCGEVTILRSIRFYPFKWTQWKKLFETNDSDFSSSFTVHLFARMSRNTTATPGGNSVLESLALNNCPTVFEKMLARDVI